MSKRCYCVSPSGCKLVPCDCDRPGGITSTSFLTGISPTGVSSRSSCCPIPTCGYQIAHASAECVLPQCLARCLFADRVCSYFGESAQDGWAHEPHQTQGSFESFLRLLMLRWIGRVACNVKFLATGSPSARYSPHNIQKLPPPMSWLTRRAPRSWRCIACPHARAPMMPIPMLDTGRIWACAFPGAMRLPRATV